MAKNNKNANDPTTEHSSEDKIEPKNIWVRNSLTRPWELVIGRKTYHFKPLEEKKLPDTVLKSPDWLQHEKYFNVRKA